MNALVIYNAAEDGKYKVGTEEFVVSIAKSYMRKGQLKRKTHNISSISTQSLFALSCKDQNFL